MPTLCIDASRFTSPATHEDASAAPVWLADRLRVAGWAATAPPEGLSLRTVVSGSERLVSPHRTIRLDPDSYLIHNRADAPPGCSQVDGRAIWLVFSATQVERAMRGAARPVFHEHLRAKDGAVGALLAALEPALLGGDVPRAWLDEQCVRLLKALLGAECELEAAALRIDCVKPSTRQELLRRVLLATDFILSHYEQPLHLENIAQAARLSRFHLLRLFRQVLGETPHAYLSKKRLSVARRLLAQPDCELHQIVVHAGFGSRWSLFRRLHSPAARGAHQPPVHRADGPMAS